MMLEESGELAALGVRLTEPTATDGLDMTVEQARALHPLEFQRLFDFKSLDDVPVVGEGYLKRAPKGARWWLRVRSADVDRAQTIELVVRQNNPKANPVRRAQAARDVDRARLDLLVKLAREAGRSRRGRSFAVEEIENMRVVEVIEAFEVIELPGLDRITRNTYAGRVGAFKAVFPDLLVGDINDELATIYLKQCNREYNTKVDDLYTAKRYIKRGLRAKGVVQYTLFDFPIPQKQRLRKTAWMPEQYDRLIAAAEGYVHDPDGSPRMTAGPDGELVQERRDEREIAKRDVWRRGVPLLAETATRHGRLAPATWTDPADAWIDISGKDVIFFRNGWHGPDDSGKRARPVILPADVAAEARGWFAKDAARGIDHVFHQPDGTPYTRHLPMDIWWRIVADAAIPERHPHELKDLFVEVAEASRMTRHAMGKVSSTTPETLAGQYGVECDWAGLKSGADEFSMSAWRTRQEQVGALRHLVEKAQASCFGSAHPVRSRRRSKSKKPS